MENQYLAFLVGIPAPKLILGRVLSLQLLKAHKKIPGMQSNRSRWIGFAISGCFLGLIAFSIYIAVVGPTPLGGFFSSVCHQWADRCYHIHDVPLPVCVRCIWIYFGLALGHTLFIFWNPGTKRITRVLIGVIGLMFLDVVLEFIGFYSNWFWSRSITGFLFGLSVSYFTLLGLQELYFNFTNSNTHDRSKLFTYRSR